MAKDKRTKSTKGKGKHADAASVDARPIRPPGVIVDGRHGPQTAAKVSPSAMDRLRSVLGLSASVDSRQVLEDAAAEIQQLRERKPRQNPAIQHGFTGME